MADLPVNFHLDKLILFYYKLFKPHSFSKATYRTSRYTYEELDASRHPRDADAGGSTQYLLAGSRTTVWSCSPLYPCTISPFFKRSFLETSLSLWSTITRQRRSNRRAARSAKIKGLADETSDMNHGRRVIRDRLCSRVSQRRSVIQEGRTRRRITAVPGTIQTRTQPPKINSWPLKARLLEHAIAGRIMIIIVQ